MASADPQALEHKLRQHIAGDVRFDLPSRLLHSTDASNYQMLPLGVVLPKTEEDVVAAVAICAEHGVPITARGGGSGLCGAALGPGVVLDFTRYMDALLDLDTGSRWVRVQPGIILSQLNRRLAAHGLQFGPDPASAERASIGGVIGANATGAHSIRYGMAADNVRALRVVLADGNAVEIAPGAAHPRVQALERAVQALVQSYADAIRQDFPRVWRRASGYNLDFILEMLTYDPNEQTRCLTFANAQRRGSNLEMHLRQIAQFHLTPLFAGAEGTLGVITEATLHLVPKPRHTALVVTRFEALLDAMRAVPALLTVEPDAIELIGGAFIRSARELPECRNRLGWLEGSGIPEGLLVIEFAADEEAELHAKVERLQRLVERERLPCTLRPLFEAQAQADVWFVRRMGLNVLTSIRSPAKPISIVEDVAVPVERLAEYVEQLDAIFERHGTQGTYYAHASAGVLHVRPLVNLRTEQGLAQMRGIAAEALALCRALGGAMSGEHGDGYERSHMNEALFGSRVYAAFCALKDLFDPNGLLNPGKKVRAVPMEDHLRLGPGDTLRAFPSVFHFGQDGSFAGLVEQCNGNGICRKLEGGVMCPSFRATREEMHSTRGRANLLRAFLRARQLPPDQSALSSEAVKAALDLCLSCKACATECVAGVDMSKLKSAFFARYYAEHGVPLRAWVLGRIGRFAPFAATLAPLTNWLISQPLAKRALRIAPQRTLPRFTPHTFDRWWRSEGRALQPVAPRGRVALFVDTFARYQHPHVAIAAVRVLTQAGYAVIVPPWRCCGRPLISQGQPEAALADVRFNVAQLALLAKQGVPILGLEPSCVSALREDYPDLLPSEDAKLVARATYGVEDWLAGQALNFPHHMRRSRRTVLLHGHCHQKALWGTQGTRRLLEQAGMSVQEIDTTCCGMAGAFGYEAEHYALSERIGELGLLPAIRAAPPETLIVAPGTSCREQIAHFTARAALHPIEVVAHALLGDTERDPASTH
ncbi:MAG: FAD-linked oxidase C-terminal domain-containing protein [Anaerolineae bacterium]|nr:FAD-binding protein [Thermoflexales bacterium]MCX7938690.1 FAD-binding protein [Thermoflexales bacterium]MDW8054286.1 FAD-linked oxidase C-terminal domain-containing protein [Anaerolineae bacterium]MDW8291552.1 FAD-linked oxidase C-terminal domain-containing protein [Anaerolineae bacterium]